MLLFKFGRSKFRDDQLILINSNLTSCVRFPDVMKKISVIKCNKYDITIFKNKYALFVIRLLQKLHLMS